MRPFRLSGKTTSRAGAGSRSHRYGRKTGGFSPLSRSAWLILFSVADEPRNLISTDERGQRSGKEGSFLMAVRGTERIARHRRRARKRILGAVFVLFGILLWGVAATAHLKPEALTYSGITIGGAAIVAGIIMFATTL
jgi:hypothetical protein